MVAAHSCIYTFEIRHFHQSEYQQQARGHGVLGTTSCEADKLARGRFLVLVIDCLASFFVHTWMNGFNSCHKSQQMGTCHDSVQRCLLGTGDVCLFDP